MIYLNIQKELFQKQETQYKNFMQKSIPNEVNLIGVRMAFLKKTADWLIKNDLWQEYISYPPFYHEEKMIQALIIAKQVKSYQDISLVEQFIPYIDNWAVCDTFCTYLKVFKTYQKEGFTLIEKLVRSSKEYKIRVGYVLLLFYFITDDYIDKIFSFMDEFKSKDYYAKMAVAWCLSICFVYD